MALDQEHRSEEIFTATHNLLPWERTAFLERACGGDAELRRESDSLLAAHEQAAHSPERRLINSRQEYGNA